MQLSWNNHFEHIVLPSWRAFIVAESRLSVAIESKAQTRILEARYEALREAGAASFYLHHYADIILRARPLWLPVDIIDIKAIRVWLANYCFMLRTETPVEDVALLGDVADVLKHAILTRHINERDVRENDAVVVISTGYGQLAYGEGNFGGIEQVIITARSRTRPLSSVLQNVVDAWRRAAGISLPEIGVA